MHRRDCLSLPLVGVLSVIGQAEAPAADPKKKERSPHSSLYRLEIANWKKMYSEKLPPIDIFSSHPDDNGEYMIVVGFREQGVGYVDFSFSVTMNGISFGKELCQISLSNDSWEIYRYKSTNTETLNIEIKKSMSDGNLPPFPPKYRAEDFRVSIIKR